MFPDGYSRPDVMNGVVEMPEKYALEMVADWMGAGRIYQDSWDMTDWLLSHIPRISLHPNTAAFVKSVLQDLNYGNDILSLDFACGRTCNCE